MTPTKQPPKSGPARENSEVRKLRNRVSQKAFRTRQAMRIKELEERLQGGSQPSTEWINLLQDRNVTLQKQLLECHKKFISLQVSMKELAEASAQALGIDSIDTHDERNTGKLCPRCQRTKLQENENTHVNLPSLDPDDGESDISPGGNSSKHDEAQAAGNNSISEMPVEDSGVLFVDDIQPQLEADPKVQATSLPSANIKYVSSDDEKLVTYADISFDPGFQDIGGHLPPATRSETSSSMPVAPSHSFSTNMGVCKFGFIKETSPFIPGQTTLKQTNSAFSDHIDALEYCIGRNWSQRDINDIMERNVTSIQSMLVIFVNLAWQSMTAWHTYTHAHVPLKELMAWRLNRSPSSYTAITPAYRPTQLQMATAYPSIIDWIPWASLRDKLIIYHAANPRLDELICDIGNSYVVPADLSLLVRCQQPIVGYVSVWDLVRAIDHKATDPPARLPVEEFNFWPQNWKPVTSTEMLSHNDMDDAGNQGDLDYQNLPVSNPDVLFSSRKIALQAFKLLGMDRGASTFFLDPVFFERHPELYDSQSNLMAQGVALRPNKRVSMESPRKLDPSVLGQYQEMSRFLRNSVASLTDTDSMGIY